MKLFSLFHVYPSNNIRSTPTWASPLYRRPLSLFGGPFSIGPFPRNHGFSFWTVRLPG